MSKEGEVGRIAVRLTTNVRTDWENMLRAHSEAQLAVEADGSLSKQIAESLRLDLDILKHSFERWLVRVDEHSRDVGEKADRTS